MKLVFISYSRADNEFVGHLRDDLRANGVNAWMDQTSLVTSAIVAWSAFNTNTRQHRSS